MQAALKGVTCAAFAAELKDETKVIWDNKEEDGEPDQVRASLRGVDKVFPHMVRCSSVEEWNDDDLG